MEFSERQKKEFSKLEDWIEEKIHDWFGDIAPAWGINAFLNSDSFSDATMKVAETIAPFMDKDTGEIDGAKVDAALKMMFPELARFVSIPHETGTIEEIINGTSKMMIGKELM